MASMDTLTVGVVRVCPFVHSPRIGLETPVLSHGHHLESLLTLLHLWMTVQEMSMSASDNPCCLWFR